MLKNNIEVDVKVKCIENGMTQAQVAVPPSGLVFRMSPRNFHTCTNG